MLKRISLVGCLVCGTLLGQGVRVKHALRLSYPVPIVDGNSPSVWINGQFRVFTSTGKLLAMTGFDLNTLREDTPPLLEPPDLYSVWIESVWLDDDGTLYAWYHHEPGGVCGAKPLTAPMIGALMSVDGGNTFRNLGIILTTGYPLNCNAENGFFAGGHGDFSVILDRDRRYFYFLFGNYSGPLASQGVAIARMAFEDRANPVGAVRKFYQGEWNEPGIGGQVTPIFPAAASWEGAQTDSLWGPAVHWNTHLNSYVALFNRACCKPGWPQEGIYIAVNKDIGDPFGWSAAQKLLDDSDIGFAPGYYPQIVGTGPGESDSLAGKTARLFVKGVSLWETIFYTDAELGLAPDEPLPAPAPEVPPQPQPEPTPPPEEQPEPDSQPAPPVEAEPAPVPQPQPEPEPPPQTEPQP